MRDRRQLAIDRLMQHAQRRYNRGGAGDNSRNILICGPPGAGKTKYANDNKEQFDFVFDYDHILSALTLEKRGISPERSIELMMSLRDSFIERSAADLKSRFWLISATPQDSRRVLMAAKMGARIIYIATPAATCIDRIGADPLRNEDMEKWEQVVSDWWEGFNPREGDMVIA